MKFSYGQQYKKLFHRLYSDHIALGIIKQGDKPKLPDGHFWPQNFTPCHVRSGLFGPQSLQGRVPKDYGHDAVGLFAEIRES